jgi:hypothetical protein
LHADVERHEIHVRILLADAQVKTDWKVYGFPAYYGLDRQGRIAARENGYSTQLGLWWRSWNVN